MKKTLQINIGGFLFTIEEDAYLKLNNYLNSIRNHFANYESCDEIIQDIEARIAEKFFKIYGNNGIVQIEEVDKIQESMGSVSDFEAVKETEDLQSGFIDKTNPGSNSENGLYRDGKRKALGGVLAGFAHKYDFDVVWARIAFLTFALGLISQNIGPALILLYVVGWIFIPQRFDLEENPSIRKFYRNPDDKVIGGVASGLATFLKIDVKIVRIIFVISGIFIVGIIFYLLFWIVAPMAHSVTQKLQLEGRPVTIENIEQSVKVQKENLPNNQESTLSKILLFPFRVIGVIFTFLGKLLRPIGGLLKILIGVFSSFTGIVLCFTTLVALAAYFGVLNARDFIATGQIELDYLINEIPPLTSIFLFLALFIPGLILILLGIRLIVNKAVGNKNLWATLLVLWLVGVMGAISIGMQMSLNFAQREQVETVQTYQIPADEILIVDTDESYSFQSNFKPYFKIKESSNNEIQVSIERTASGPNIKVAKQLAQNITYPIKNEGSKITFNSKFDLKDNDPFRNQRASLTLEIPKGRKFKFTKNFLSVFGFPRGDYSENGERDRSGNNTFIINDNNEIACLDCPVNNPYDEVESEFDSEVFTWNYEDLKNKTDMKSIAIGEKLNSVSVSSNYNILFIKGDTTTVQLFSDQGDYTSQSVVRVQNGQLKINYSDPFKEYDSPTFVYITTPELPKISLENGAKLKLYGFDNVNNSSIEITNNSEAAIHLNANNLDLIVDDKSKVMLQGKINLFMAKVSKKSLLKADKAKIDDARVKAYTSSVVEMGTVRNKAFVAEKTSVIKQME